MFYQLDLCTICPDLKLINCCRTESISCSKQYFFAVLAQIVCQFSDGCGFADTVYTNNQQDAWFGAQIAIDGYRLKGASYSGNGAYIQGWTDNKYFSQKWYAASPHVDMLFNLSNKPFSIN